MKHRSNSDIAMMLNQSFYLNIYYQKRNIGQNKGKTRGWNSQKLHIVKNLIWHSNSTYFSDEKTALAFNLGSKLGDLQTLVFYTLWGP